MKHNFWHNKWETNHIFFHQEDINPFLKKFFRLPAGKIVVPLCGKSSDMIWLASQGHQVMGIELSPIACEAFFQENNLPYQKIGRLYQGDRRGIWCGDFFDAPSHVWENCTGLYDRAALIALPKEMRKTYATHMIQQLQKEKETFVQMLLICLEYDQQLLEGPPFSVTESEVTELFGSIYSIQQQQSETTSFKSIPEGGVLQKAYSLTLPAT